MSSYCGPRTCCRVIPTLRPSLSTSWPAMPRGCRRSCAAWRIKPPSLPSSIAHRKRSIAPRLPTIAHRSGSTSSPRSWTPPGPSLSGRPGNSRQRRTLSTVPARLTGMPREPWALWRKRPRPRVSTSLSCRKPSARTSGRPPRPSAPLRTTTRRSTTATAG